MAQNNTSTKDFNEMAKNIQKKYNLRYKPGLFFKKENAITSASRSKGVHGAPWVAIVGDNGMYWTVVLSDFSKLIKKGFKEVK